MNDVIKTLRTGYPGTKTKTPWESAAIQIWYWQKQSSNDILPNQANKEEYLDLKVPLTFRSTRYETIWKYKPLNLITINKFRMLLGKQIHTVSYN